MRLALFHTALCCIYVQTRLNDGSLQRLFLSKQKIISSVITNHDISSVCKTIHLPYILMFLFLLPELEVQLLVEVEGIQLEELIFEDGRLPS